MNGVLQATKRARKNESSLSELLQQAKQRWETVRVRTIEPERRRELVKELLDMLGGHLQELVMKHDASRVVQTLLKYGSGEQRNAIFQQLEDKVLELAKSKYGHQLVQKLLRYGTRVVREALLRQFRGRMVRMLTHNYGAIVLEEGCTRAWRSNEVRALLQEAYGPEFIHFKAPERSLSALLEAHPERRKAAMDSLRHILQRQADKGLLGLTVSHKLLADYFEAAEPADCGAMVETVREAVVALMGSREGGRAACAMFGYGSAKDRKLMARKISEHLDEVAIHDQGHRVVVRALDTTDDTKTSSKYLLQPLLTPRSRLARFLTDPYGCKVFLHVLARQHPRYFGPIEQKLLQPCFLPDTSADDGATNVRC